MKDTGSTREVAKVTSYYFKRKKTEKKKLPSAVASVVDYYGRSLNLKK